MPEAMTLTERKKIEKEFGVEKIKDIFVDFIVNRKSHAEVCKDYKITSDKLDDLLRVCFYQLDEAGNNAVQAIDEQKLIFDVVFSKLGKGTQKRVKQALKRVTQNINEGKDPMSVSR